MKKKTIIMTAFACFGALVAICFLLSSAPIQPQGSCIVSAYYTQYAYPFSYGKLDTVGASGTDTFKMACQCSPKSITFSADFYKVGGTPAVTVNLYTSINGGITYSTAAVTSFTVSPTSTSINATPAAYIVNGAGGGSPATNYMWVSTNSSAATMSWQGQVLIK